MSRSNPRSPLGLLIATVAALLLIATGAGAQGWRPLTEAAGDIAASQARLTEPAAATVSRICTSISSKSGRCHRSFAPACKKSGGTVETCTRMAGFCHACTDMYATCRGDAMRSASGAPADCAACNTAYDRCLRRMVDQYGLKGIWAR